MSKKSRKLVGKPTGRVTKAGRPVLKTPQGEERSESVSYTHLRAHET